jgi:glutamate dehydrogenase
MSEQPGDGKDQLLTAAANVADAVPGVGDVHKYLDAYYRHVAVDDMVEAGPERLAAVAASHAAFATQRPQGRALVRMRPGDTAALRTAADVIDIVTDDMPFLVDSITMALATHGLSPRLVVHPQLRVRRDVSGALHEVLGQVNGGQPSHDELAESWTHVEVARLTTDKPDQIVADLDRVLGDVRVAVEDYTRMRAKAIYLANQVLASDPSAASGDDDADSSSEIAALLHWLADGHFTFLGYREYDLEHGPDGMMLKAVPGSGLGILRHDRPGPGSFATLPAEVRARALEPNRLIVTKANSRSTVHRPSYLDYVAVKRISDTGQVVGEYRLLGLYTHRAFTESIGGIPVLRRKLADVLAATGLAADSHDGKDLAEVLDFYPREELFMTSVPELTAITKGVLRLRERRQTRLFLRRDIYGRYVSAMVFLPRDGYTTQVRLRAQEVLERAFGGAQVDYSVQVGESPVARLHIVVRADKGTMLPEVSAAELERAVASAVRSWDDDLADEAVRQLGDQRARELLALGGDAIPATYKTDVPASVAVTDLLRILEMREVGEDVAFDLWESEDYVGGVPLEPEDIDAGPAAGPRSPTCCRGCSTWAST